MIVNIFVLVLQYLIIIARDTASPATSISAKACFWDRASGTDDSSTDYLPAGVLHVQ